jgi:hypothetical protein
MNLFQQRLAIAKFCGWTYNKHNVWHNKHTNETVCMPLEYTTCLNAMHDAEKHLSAEQQVIYSTYLTPAYDSKEDTMEIFASASRRAEAFLKTINKWKPEKV